MILIATSAPGLDWELINKWSQLLTIIGFIITIISLIITVSIRSQVSKIRASYTFDKRVNEHIKQLNSIGSLLNDYFNDYNSSRNLIKFELGKCQSELEDIAIKLNFNQRKKVRRLISFIKKRKEKTFSLKESSLDASFLNLLKLKLRSSYETSYNDIWKIYRSIYEIITQIENIKKNKKTILN